MQILCNFLEFASPNRLMTQALWLLNRQLAGCVHHRFYIERIFLKWRLTGGQGGGGFALAPWCWLDPPWICWEFYFTCKSIQAFNDTIKATLYLCKNSRSFYQITCNEKSKIKISLENMPPEPPGLPNAFNTDTYLPPIIHTISFAPPWAKCGRNHVPYSGKFSLVQIFE